MSHSSAPLWHAETIAIRSGSERTMQKEHSEPMFLTSSFVYDNAAQAAAVFLGEEVGNIYGRFTNPTVNAFEQRLAAMEGAERAIASASGMAAILSVCMAYLKAGDHIVCSRSIFGASVALFEKYVAKFAIDVSFVELTDLSVWQQQVIPDRTKLFFIETPSNPLSEIADISALADLAHQHQALLVVDNSFCTPVLQRPLDFGADLVLYSATKYIDGQGRTLGGAIVGSSKLLDEVFAAMRTLGPCLSPFNAWVLLKGLETLGIRMQAHSENASKLVQWLRQQPQVEKVYYAGLTDHPGHLLAKRQQSDFGGIVSFVVRGERKGAWTVIDNTQLISITGNLGDVKSTITHPATTTHGKISAELKQSAGIEEGLIRVSVGLEHIDDIIGDIERGLAKI